jgi:hypothetical protein
MRASLDPFSFLVISVAGWINQRQQQVIEYLIEENRVLREQIGNRRMPYGPKTKIMPPSGSSNSTFHRVAVVFLRCRLSRPLFPTV